MVLSLLRQEWTMRAQIGKYKVQMKKSSLLLQHIAGIGFELTQEEALGLLQFLQVYQQTLLKQRSADDPQTQPIIRIIGDEDDQPDEPA